jgi:predicted cobalt transporter CbtA
MPVLSGMHIQTRVTLVKMPSRILQLDLTIATGLFWGLHGYTYQKLGGSVSVKPVLPRQPSGRTEGKSGSIFAAVFSMIINMEGLLSDTLSQGQYIFLVEGFF